MVNRQITLKMKVGFSATICNARLIFFDFSNCCTLKYFPEVTEQNI